MFGLKGRLWQPRPQTPKASRPGRASVPRYVFGLKGRFGESPPDAIVGTHVPRPSVWADRDGLSGRRPLAGPERIGVGTTVPRPSVWLIGTALQPEYLQAGTRTLHSIEPKIAWMFPSSNAKYFHNYSLMQP